MGVLAWLGIPAGATALAILWVQWASRTRGPVKPRHSVAERERFNAVFDPPQQQHRRAS